MCFIEILCLFPIGKSWRNSLVKKWKSLTNLQKVGLISIPVYPEIIYLCIAYLLSLLHVIWLLQLTPMGNKRVRRHLFILVCLLLSIMYTPLKGFRVLLLKRSVNYKEGKPLAKIFYSDDFLLILWLFFIVRKDDSSSSDEETPQDSHTPLIKVSLNSHFWFTIHLCL